MATPLVSGQTHRIESPFGTQGFLFDDAVTPCQSIKVNQVGYAEGSRVRHEHQRLKGHLRNEM